MLTPDEIEQFVEQGFVRIDDAVPRALADAIRERALSEAAPRFGDGSAAIKLGDQGDDLSVQAINSPPLLEAYDQLVGRERWRPPSVLMDLRVLLPAAETADWWHIDVNLPGPDGVTGDLLSWRADLASSAFALLALVHFSKVGAEQGATVMRAGSHRAVARRLAPAGEAGMALGDLITQGFEDCADAPLVESVGEVGTAYLCHPFLVHTARLSPKASPRVQAVQVLLPADDFRLGGAGAPVGRAIGPHA